MFLGAYLFILSMILIGSMTRLWHFYLYFGILLAVPLTIYQVPLWAGVAIWFKTRMGVAMLNVHAAGGVAMLGAASDAASRAAKDFGVARPACIAVTVLTSLDRKGLDEIGVAGNVEAQVLRLAERARDAGLEGCVASPQEIGLLRRALGPAWVIVTPGIRPAQSHDDQRRIATLTMAIGAGADAIVVGRPITAAHDPHAATVAILAEMARASRAATRG